MAWRVDPAVYDGFWDVRKAGGAPGNVLIDPSGREGNCRGSLVKSMMAECDFFQGHIFAMWHSDVTQLLVPFQG